VETVLLACKRSDFEDYIKVIFGKFGKEIIMNVGIPYILIPEMYEKLRFDMNTDDFPLLLLLLLLLRFL
jgi:hypothetical protein